MSSASRTLILSCRLGLLELHADPPVHLGAIGLRVHPQDPHLPGVPPPQPLDAFDRGGLARAVRAEDAENLPLPTTVSEIPSTTAFPP